MNKFDFIPKIVEKRKNYKYYRNDMVEKAFKDKLADCVLIYFYNSILQYRNGLAFCIAIWNEENSYSPMDLGNCTDKIQDIDIRWGNTKVISDIFLQENRFDKGTYLKLLKSFYENVKSYADKIQDIISKYDEGNYNYPILKNKILELREPYNSISPNEIEEKHTPYECEDLDRAVTETHIMLAFSLY